MNQSAFVAVHTLLLGFGVRWKAIVAAAVLALAWATPALAGPPYLTDDPDPTDTGHYEIYAFSDGLFASNDYEGVAGVDLNYGPVPDVQLTATLPVDVTSAGRPNVSRGEVEIGVKWRFLEDQQRGLSLAMFPRVFLPTSRTSGRASLLLPLWAGWKNEHWAVFGGGGVHVRAGAGNRDSLVEALAVTRSLGERLTIGAEIAHEGTDAVGGEGAATLGLGAVVGLGGPFSLLLSGGPQRGDRSHDVGLHAYAALGLTF